MNFANEYFTIHVLSSGTITFTTTTPTGSASPYIIEIDYSVNEGIWEGILSSTTGSLLGTFNTGDKIRVKGTNPLSNKSNRLYSNYFGGTAEVEVYGNILSLVHGDNFTNFNACTQIYEFTHVFYNYSNLKSAQHLVFPATCYEACYNSMFENCTGLTIAPEQLSTTLAENCYKSMFKGCTSLLIIPPLPVTSLAPGCYGNMFQGCTSLITPPVLPATILTSYCYSSMFYGCTNLTSAPVLSATNLEPYCYANMFEGCTKLEVAPELPALVLKESCYNAMFYECYSLKKMPELPATTLTPDCYCMMFWMCSSLETASILPATNLESYCYADMFYGCRSLTVPPELPATTLKNNCYDEMFRGCDSLTQAPLLPALTLVSNCYRNMFYGCEHLNYIRALFTTTPSTSYTSNWVYGVASTGTFIKNAAATWNVTGVNGVPTGWNATSVNLNNYTLIDPNFTCTEIIDIQDIISWSNIDIVEGSNYPSGGDANRFIINNWARSFPWAQETELWNQICNYNYVQFLDSNFASIFSRNYHYEDIAYVKNTYSDWNSAIVNADNNGSNKDIYTQYACTSGAAPIMCSITNGVTVSNPNLWAWTTCNLDSMFQLEYGYNDNNSQLVGKRTHNNITIFLVLIYTYFSLNPHYSKHVDNQIHILGENDMENICIPINRKIIIVFNNLSNIHGFSNYAVLQHMYNGYYGGSYSLTSLDEYDLPKIYYGDYSCEEIFPISYINGGVGIEWQIFKIKHITGDPGPWSAWNGIPNEISVVELYNILENYNQTVNRKSFNHNDLILHGIFYDFATDTLFVLVSDDTPTAYYGD